MADDFVDLTYAKSGGYLEALQSIVAAGVCPFCPEHFNWHPNPILRRSRGWLLTESMQPYEGAARHYLLICQTHKESLAELGNSDMLEVLQLSRHATQLYAAELGVHSEAVGGGLMFRFGDTRHTGATVKHLHAHVIFPQIDPASERAVPVYFPIG